LPAGISRVEFNAYASDDRDAVNLDYLDVAATSGTVTSYEAEASGNTLSGTAVVVSDSAASGGRYVGWLGAGAANTLRFNNVTVGNSSSGYAPNIDRIQIAAPVG